MNLATWVERHGRDLRDRPALAEGDRVHATWAEFAARGIGAWPLQADVDTFMKSSAQVEATEVRRLLLTYGYAVEAGEAGLKLAIEAFQRHFRGKKVDAETVAILRALVKRYRVGATAPSPAPATARPAKNAKLKP